MFVCLVAIASCGVAAADPNPFDIVLARERAVMLSQAPPSAALVSHLCTTLAADGSWPDIDYTDQEVGNWKTSEHLHRVELLSLAFEKPGAPSCGDSAVASAVTLALDYWIAHRFKNLNWWHNEIGVPIMMRDIIVLLGDRLDGYRRVGALSILNQYGRAHAGNGANTVWEASLGLDYALLTHNDALAAEQSAIIAREIHISSGEGIQSDYSFHQHGPRLQQFHYGGSFLAFTSRLARELVGTAWAIPPDKVRLLVNMVLEGDQWMVRRQSTVPGTLDRAVSRPGSLHIDLDGVLGDLVAAAPEFADALRAVSSRAHGKLPALTGFRSFPRSDFAAYHRPDFSFFVKTTSTRTKTTESINHENLKGHLLGCGDSYLLRDGNEYMDMPPVWNWDLIPGITWAQGAGDIRHLQFAGSIGDDQGGATAMDYAFAGKPGAALTAGKFWACEGDTVVCLIGSLIAIGIDAPVRTALDNCLMRGPVVACNKAGAVMNVPEGVHEARPMRWIYHSGFLYIPLADLPISLQAGPQTGSWASINHGEPSTIVTRPVFLPVLEHGVAPAGQSSGYVVMSCSDASQAGQIAAHPTWRILRNDATCQAVAFADGAVMAAFYQPGKLAVDQTDIVTMAKPCLYFRRGDKAMTFDPITGEHR